MQSDNECYRILIRDYFFPSPYIDVPDNCLWWTIFWFRINRYTIFTTGQFIIYVLFEYDISAYHSLTYLYIWTSLLFNAHWAKKQENIFYRDAPYLFHLLLTVLYLEKKPFHFSDAQLIERCYNIDMENYERLSAHEEADSRCWSESIGRIRQCDHIVDVKQIIRQADEQVEKNLLIYQLMDKPKRPPLEQKKTNIFLIIFIHLSSFLLMALAIRNYMLIFQSIRSYI